MIPAAIGLRAHSGWAAMVVLAGGRARPTVAGRSRIVIADTKIPGSKQPFHAAERRPLAEAEQYLRRCEERSVAMAREALREAVEQARAGGSEVRACGLLLASGRPLPELRSVLASHALIHAAEGEVFRRALAEAAAALGLAVSGVREKDLLAQAESALGVTSTEIQAMVAALGKPLGAPWTQDEKQATIAAWIALAAGKTRTAAV